MHEALSYIKLGAEYILSKNVFGGLKIKKFSGKESSVE